MEKREGQSHQRRGRDKDSERQTGCGEIQPQLGPHTPLLLHSKG